jgi:hypothetical protein
MSLHPLPVATKSPKAELLSLRSFRNVALAAALPLSLLCAGRAEAISTITQTISNTTPTTPFSTLSFSRTSPQSTSNSYTQAFNKFDTSKGKLVGVRFQGDGDLLGHLRAARSSNSTPLSELTGATTSLNVTFGTWSTNNTGGDKSFVNTTTPVPITIATPAQLANGTTGTLLTSTDPELQLSGSDTTTYLSLFEGTGTINGIFTWTVNMSSNNLAASGTCSSLVQCTGFNFQPSGADNTALYGDINEFKLFYDFIPSVPGPLPILGSGVAFAYTRRLRRRIQKASFTS